MRSRPIRELKDAIGVCSELTYKAKPSVEDPGELTLTGILDLRFDEDGEVIEDE